MSDKDKKPTPKPASQPSRLENVMSKKPSAMAFDSAPAGLRTPATPNQPSPKRK